MNLNFLKIDPIVGRSQATCFWQQNQ